MQGPYKNQKWLIRLGNLEGIFQILQLVCFLLAAAFTGFEWISNGQILKFVLIFGGCALTIFLGWMSRLPLFFVAAAAIALTGAFLG